MGEVNSNPFFELPWIQLAVPGPAAAAAEAPAPDLNTQSAQLIVAAFRGLLNGDPVPGAAAAQLAGGANAPMALVRVLPEA